MSTLSMSMKNTFGNKARSLMVVVIFAFIGLLDLCPTAEEVKGENLDETDIVELTGLPETGNYNFVTLADVNKDTYLDIIASGAGEGGWRGYAPGGLHVYLNQNGSSFIEASNGLPRPGDEFFGSTHGSLTVVDIDNDSNLDIVACEFLTREDLPITIWLGNGGSGGSMKWTMAAAPEMLSSWYAVSCGDFDGDGQIDLVASCQDGLYAWRGNHSPGVLNWTKARSGIPDYLDHMSGITLADVNKDGRLDIVAGSERDIGVSIYSYSASGDISWTEAHSGTALIERGVVWDVFLTDLDGDSNLDMIASTDMGIKAYLGNGNSGDRSTWWVDVSWGLPSSGTYYQLDVGDIDNDGKADISSSLQVWSNSGKMTDASSYSWVEVNIGLSEIFTVGNSLGDLDLDGNTDIVSCGWEENFPGIHAFTSLMSGTVVPAESPVATDTYVIRITEVDDSIGGNGGDGITDDGDDYPIEESGDISAVLMAIAIIAVVGITAANLVEKRSAK